MLSARRSLLLPLATALTTLAIPSASSARLLETRTAVQEAASRDRAGLQRELSLGSYWRNLDLGAEVASGSSKFLQTDPAGFIDGPNLYTAFGNDPVNAGDPSGLRSVFQMPGMSPINYGDDSAWNVTRSPTTFIPDIRPDSPPEAAAYGVAGAAADMGIGSFNQSLAVTLGPAGIVAHHLGYLVPYADEWMPYAGDEAYEDAYLATNIVVAVGGAMVGTAGGVRRGPPRSSLMTRREEMILANRARSAALRQRYGSTPSRVLHERINLRGAVKARHDLIRPVGRPALLSGRQRGPVLSGVKDLQTGEVFYGLNTETIETLHPLLAGRTIVGDVLHSEVVALNRALFARGAGASVNLHDFLLFNARFSRNLGLNIQRCPTCQRITRGVQSLSDVYP